MDAGLTLVADLSHWIAVAETNCDDPDLTQVIEDLAPKCRHIHLRVGYDHGPQVCCLTIDFRVKIKYQQIIQLPIAFGQKFEICLYLRSNTALNSNHLFVLSKIGNKP